MKKFDFQKSCAAMLIELGAGPDDGDYRQVLQTIAGPMRVKACDNWLHCQFVDEKLAVKMIGFGSLNHYSGKWNWHYTKPTQSDLDDLRQKLESILVKEIA